MANAFLEAIKWLINSTTFFKKSVRQKSSEAKFLETTDGGKWFGTHHKESGSPTYEAFLKNEKNRETAP